MSGVLSSPMLLVHSLFRVLQVGQTPHQVASDADHEKDRMRVYALPSGLNTDSVIESKSLVFELIGNQSTVLAFSNNSLYLVGTSNF